MALLVREDINLVRCIFLVREMSNFLTVAWDSPLIPGYNVSLGTNLPLAYLKSAVFSVSPGTEKFIRSPGGDKKP